MAHSSDIRVRVLDFIRGGGSKAEAARIFKVSRGCIYSWLARGNDISARKPGPKGSHKVDMAALAARLKATPDICLSELSAELGVYPSTLHYACKRLRVTRKKNLPIFSRNIA
jgi:hypothetical protein